MSRLAFLTVGAIAGLAAVRGPRRGSRALVDEGMVGEFWGSQGSGLLLSTGERVLLTLRSRLVLDPGTWGIPGGAVPVDDRTGEAIDPLESAVTETYEETGLATTVGRMRSNLRATTVFRPPHSSFRFTTYVVGVQDDWPERAICLDWENDEAAWFTPAELLDLDLHHGVVFTLRQAWTQAFSPSAPGFGRRAELDRPR
jgi:8-oxo-dGTP pyrophosphatase MutT (NUDIX family)